MTVNISNYVFKFKVLISKKQLFYFYRNINISKNALTINKYIMLKN